MERTISTLQNIYVDNLQLLNKDTGTIEKKIWRSISSTRKHWKNHAVSSFYRSVQNFPLVRKKKKD